MKKSDFERQIEVWADWRELGGAQLMGVLSARLVRGQELFAFSYEQRWLDSRFTQTLDPGLRLFRGEQYNDSAKANFGIFLDSSPDRWGRFLQKRRIAIQARKSGEKEPRILESDYLLGVYDKHRLGGIRFKSRHDGPFLNDDHELSVPPMTSLRELEAAAWAIENEKETRSPEEDKWIRMLIAPGGSLGGARPKASVLSENGELWIAKFPSRTDQNDSGLWEYLVHELAKTAGITLPEAKVRKFRGPQHTFLTKRFDRDGHHRLHFASAMTMLDKNDGASSQDGSSYLELAEFLLHSGANVSRDLEQLWRRIVFSICVSNTDDHLRNHGFLLTQNGWVLSPAFDINPNPDGEGLKLNISESDNSQDLELALSVAPYFRLQASRAKKILDEVVGSASNWKKLASKLKFPKSEIHRMARAFRIANQ